MDKQTPVNNTEKTKKQLLKTLKDYDRLYYISIFINMLILISILLEIVFIFVIENEYIVALVSLIVSFILAIISFCMKFAFNNAVSELLLYLVDKEDSRNKSIVDNLAHITTVLSLFEDKTSDSEQLIQILKLFNYSSAPKEKITLEEKKEPVNKEEEYNITKVLNDNK